MTTKNMLQRLSLLTSRKRTSKLNRLALRRQLFAETLEDRLQMASDFGDAPVPYPVTTADIGAVHETTGPTLGAARDDEADGTNSPHADFDDLNGTTPDDEDGLTFVGAIRVGEASVLTVNVQGAPSGAFVDAWIDLDRNGAWDATDQIADTLAVVNGANNITITVPATSIAGASYVRVRLSSIGNLDPTGPALDGEVEDAEVTILPATPQVPFLTAAQQFTQSTPVAIPTGPAVVTSTIVVSGMGTYLFDANVLTFLPHTFPADLDITITSPAGTVVTLTTDNGGDNDNIFNGTIWDDDANPSGQVPYTSNNGLVTDSVYAINVLASPLVPEEALGAFIGENPNGTWTITISDDLSGDGGSLDSWTLDLTTLDFAPVTNATTFTNSTATPIPDAIDGSPDTPSVVASTIVVSGLTSVISDVNLTTFLTHTFPGDLDITIMSPAGTIVTLTTDNGVTNDDIFNGTLWDDDANPAGQVPYTSNNGMVTDSVYAVGVLASPLTPEEALAAFIGEDPNGIWTITISDDVFVDTGTLNSWSLEITTFAEVDYGDAPTGYPVTLAEGGAAHAAVGPTLGATRDTEVDGTHSAAADADDTTGSDDEDGVTPLTFIAGQSDDLTVSLSGVAFINAWADLNNDLVFDASELVATNLAGVAGDNTVTVSIPVNYAGATIALRFRATTSSIATPLPTGYLPDGEVEDYVFDVTPAEVAPVLDPIGAQTVDELTTLTFTATATDANAGDNLTFSLDAASLAAGMTIDATTGAFSWTPTEAQGPGVFSVTVTVTDDSAGTLSDSETFDITVAEVNVDPVLAAIPDKTIKVGNTLAFVATATDSDLPAQGLSYSLDAASVAAGMTINAMTGAFSFKPTVAQANHSFNVTVTVEDSEGGTDTDTFKVTVPKIPVAGGGTTVTVIGTPDADVVVIAKAGTNYIVYAYVGTAKLRIFAAKKIADFVVNVGAGNDSVVIDATVNVPTTIRGGAGIDVLSGGSSRDNIDGGAGNDQIFGNLGDDILRGQAGDDAIYGGLGNDVVSGGTGNDIVTGDLGNDIVLGGLGLDVLSDSAGHDLLIGGKTANEGNAVALSQAIFDWLNGNTSKTLLDLGAYQDDQINDVFAGDLTGDVKKA